PGATRCPGAAPGSVESCDADGLGWTASACPVAQSCSGGACRAWLCTPGTPGCVGSTGTRACNADGLAYGATTTCAAGASCTPATGLCGAWICTPGTATCEGATRRVCNADGLGYTSATCTATQNCTAGVCVDQVCTPGALSCADVNTRRRCNATGAGYDAAPCAAMNACLASGTCAPWTCTPGPTAVCASATARQVCAPDGQGFVSTPCPSAANAAAACAAGLCAITCNAGFGDCDGAATNGCEVDTSASAAHCGRCGAACPAGQSCAAGVCRSTSAPANDSCAGAVVIPMTAANTNLTGTNVGAGVSLSAPCGSNAGADVFYRFVVPGPSPEMVYADTQGSNFDTVLYFARDCSTALTTSTTTGEVLCNDDLGGAGCATSTQSTVVARLTAGTWYLVVAGYNGTSGSINLRFQHLPVGGGTLAQLPVGSSTQSGATSGAGLMGGACGGSQAGEATWWWRTCPEAVGGAFSASTCSRANWDTLIYQRNATGADLCSDDSCSAQSAINGSIPPGAGIHTFTVDGFSINTGSFSVQVLRP
ncbi:MAG: uncharacterized protein JWM10_2498, partial [Myxococcaceae bacterium]|nr:uncharacterized protein [Myxococcaceae bacterium]